MKPTVVALSFLLALGAPIDALATGADDAPPMQLELPPNRDVIADDGGAANAPPATPATPLPYRSAQEYRSPPLPRSNSAYHDFMQRFTVPEIIENNAAPTVRMALNSRVGVQWGTDGRRPSLEYRMSGNTVMRLRGSRHGARIIMHVKF